MSEQAKSPSSNADSATDVSLESLELWKLAFSIRRLVEDGSFYYAVNPLIKEDTWTVISAVEQVFLTEGMLRSYLDDPEPRGTFACDLRKWGAVQALFVQQDAVDALGKVFKFGGIDFKTHAVLGPIREDLRNRYVGHPVADRKNGKFVVTAISSEREASFLELGKDGLQHRRFDLVKAINDQMTALKDRIIEIKSSVMKPEDEFKQQLRREDPLAVVRFSTNFDYTVSKCHPGESAMQEYHSQDLVKHINDFKIAFSKVGHLTGIIEAEMTRMEYAGSEVEKFFNGDESGRRLTSADIEVFLDFLTHGHSRLLEYVAEIDADLGS